MADRLLPVAFLGLPLLTWVEPRKTPASIFDLGFYLTPLIGLLAFGLVLVAWRCVAPWSRPVAAFAAYAGVSTVWSVAPEDAAWVVLGCVLIATVAQGASRWMLLGLLVLGCLEVAVQVLQVAGVMPFKGWLTDARIPHGTFGNPRYLGAALAGITPLAPPILLPVFVVGVVLSQSFGAWLGVLVALLVRFRSHWRLILPLAALAMVAILGFRSNGFVWRELYLGTPNERLAMLTASLILWPTTVWTVLFGHGLGSWFPQVGARLNQYHAHNEPVQALYELGLVGVGLLAWALWSHRRLILGSPALLALGIVSLTISPFHFGAVAVVVCGVLGVEACGTGWRSQPVRSTSLPSWRLPSCTAANPLVIR